MAHMLTMAPTNTQEVPIKGLTQGWHTFYALLVDNHHMALMSKETGAPITGTVATVTLFVRK